jgi:hypothetical protein
MSKRLQDIKPARGIPAEKADEMCRILHEYVQKNHEEYLTRNQTRPVLTLFTSQNFKTVGLVDSFIEVSGAPPSYHSDLTIIPEWGSPAYRSSTRCTHQSDHSRSPRRLSNRDERCGWERIRDIT